MPKFTAKCFILEGQVQGVGCRAQVQEWVEGIGHLSGHVRNLPDGTVEVCLKGPDWRMNDIEKVFRLKMLPPVRIDNLRVTPMPEDYAPTGFVVKRG